MTCRRKADCWCSVCHLGRYNEYSQKDSRTLLLHFNTCQEKEKQLLTKLFEQVLMSIAIAKAFRVKAEQETGYKQMKRHLVYLGMQPDEASSVARVINNAVWVYDNFQRITNNLMTCTDIDIRRLSLHQLYLAKDMSWCLMYQEQLQKQKNKPSNLDYDEESFDDLVRCVQNHDAFLAVSDDPKRLVALMARLQKKVLEDQLKK